MTQNEREAAFERINDQRRDDAVYPSTYYYPEKVKIMIDAMASEINRLKRVIEIAEGSILGRDGIDACPWCYFSIRAHSPQCEAFTPEGNVK
jgi:hypothetical protein